MNEEKRGQSSKEEIKCPFCHSTDTEMLALFGQQLMTTQHYCNNCHSAFEAVKWEDAKNTKPKAESKSAGVEEGHRN